MSRRGISLLATWMLAAVPAAHAQHVHPAPPPAAPEAATAPVQTPAPEAPAVPAGPTYTLDDLLARAATHNPEIAAAQAAVRAASGRSLQAGLPPNPVVGYTAEDVPLDRGHGGGRHGVFLRQEIPLGGKLARAREVEERRLERARIEAEAGLLAAQTRLRLLYGKILAAQETIAVRARLAALGREAVEVTRQLYNTGAADTPDLLAIEDEASLLAAAAADAGFEREALWGELQAAVADPPLAPGRLAGDLSADLPPLDEAEWKARIRRESPAVRRAAGTVAEAESALERERSIRRPDLELEGALRKDRPPSGSGIDAGWEASADLGIRLPLWNRNQGAIAAATAELDRARLEARRAELAADAGFATAWARYRQAATKSRAYREGILDRARRAHRLYLEKYRQMTAAYPQVLVAERTLRQLEDDAIAAAAQAWEQAVRIEGLLVEPTPEGGVATAEGGRR